MVSAERLRLDEAVTGRVAWRQARSRAYRRGEDGLAGVGDDRQQLCLALGSRNVRDPDPKRALADGDGAVTGWPVPWANVAAADWDAAGLFVDLGPWQSHRLALQ